MSKIAFIIPGFGCPTKNKEYQQIAGFFKKKNIKPILIETDWKRNTHLEYVVQFKEQYLRNVDNGDQVYVLGFSFGAMTACITAPELKPTMQILCSLSPFFKEDIPLVKSWWIKYHGKHRKSVFEKLSFSDIAKKTVCKTIILAGNKEGNEVEHRAKDAKKKIKNSELVFIDGVNHNIADEGYLKKIKEIIEKI
ncbi:MAG: hypothetical protein WC823_04315 [Parcubacteria group bacterium]|jgi:hypothetical protein